MEVESDERGVEDLSDDGSDDAAEERLPAQWLGPEWRQVFHGEQKTSNRRVEPSRHSGRHASCRKLSPTPDIFLFSYLFITPLTQHNKNTKYEHTNT